MTLSNTCLLYYGHYRLSDTSTDLELDNYTLELDDEIQEKQETKSCNEDQEKDPIGESVSSIESLSKVYQTRC